MSNLSQLNDERQRKSLRRKKVLYKFVLNQPNSKITEELLAKFYTDAYGYGIQSFRNDIMMLVKTGQLKKKMVIEFQAVKTKDPSLILDDEKEQTDENMSPDVDKILGEIKKDKTETKEETPKKDMPKTGDLHSSVESFE